MGIMSLETQENISTINVKGLSDVQLVEELKRYVLANKGKITFEIVSKEMGLSASFASMAVSSVLRRGKGLREDSRDRIEMYLRKKGWLNLFGMPVHRNIILENGFRQIVREAKKQNKRRVTIDLLTASDREIISCLIKYKNGEGKSLAQLATYLTAEKDMLRRTIKAKRIESAYLKTNIIEFLQKHDPSGKYLTIDVFSSPAIASTSIPQHTMEEQVQSSDLPNLATLDYQGIAKLLKIAVEKKKEKGMGLQTIEKQYQIPICALGSLMKDVADPNHAPRRLLFYVQYIDVIISENLGFMPHLTRDVLKKYKFLHAINIIAYSARKTQFRFVQSLGFSDSSLHYWVTKGQTPTKKTLKVFEEYIRRNTMDDVPDTPPTIAPVPITEQAVVPPPQAAVVQPAGVGHVSDAAVLIVSMNATPEEKSLMMKRLLLGT